MERNKIEKIIKSIQEAPLFQQAFIHSSFANENKEKKISDYETLEFLGDSILNMHTCLYIYQNYPHYSEGEMSKLKQFMVQQKTLAELSKKTKLFRFLKLGAGEEKNKGKQKASTLADIFESFVAALYLEKGAKTVEKFLDLSLFAWIKGKETLIWDYKTQLQELCQTQNNRLTYRVVKWSNQTKNKQFVIEVRDSLEKIRAQGQGKSKKEAEQAAARHALEKIGNLK